MKKLYTLSTLLFFSFLFYSCGSDKPDDLPVSINATAEKSFTITAQAGDVTTKTITFTLDDFAKLKDYKKYVDSGVIQTSSFIEVKGVSGDVELVDVKLSMNRDPKNNFTLPDITKNEKYQGINELNFLDIIIKEVSSRGTSTVKLEYKSNTSFTSPVIVSLYLNSVFSF